MILNICLNPNCFQNHLDNKILCSYATPRIHDMEHAFQVQTEHVICYAQYLQLAYCHRVISLLREYVCIEAYHGESSESY